MTADEPDEAFDAQVTEFLVQVDDVLARYTESGDPKLIWDLARQWRLMSGLQEPPTYFAELVTLATHAGKMAEEGWSAARVRRWTEAPPDGIFLDLSIYAWQTMVRDPKFAEASALSRTVSWNNLAENLRRKFEATTDLAALNEGIDCQIRAVEALTPEVPTHSDYHTKLSLMLFRRYQHQEQLQDLEDSVGLLRAWAESLPTASSQQAEALLECTVAACRTGIAAKLEEALGRLRLCLTTSCMPSEERMTLLMRLAARARREAQLIPGIEICDNAFSIISGLLSELKKESEVIEWLEDELARVAGWQMLAALGTDDAAVSVLADQPPGLH